MAKPKQAMNPFYGVLVVVGVLFAITACAYGVMAFRAVASAPAPDVSASGLDLMKFLDRYGLWVMLVQIVLLAIATVGAITTDDYWTKRSRASNQESPISNQNPNA